MVQRRMLKRLGGKAVSLKLEIHPTATAYAAQKTREWSGEVYLWMISNKTIQLPIDTSHMTPTPTRGPRESHYSLPA